VLKLKPDNSEALFYLGNAYSKLNLYTQAEKNYIKANSIGHSKNTFQKLYKLYFYKLKDLGKAKLLKNDFEKNNPS
jgi:tetratricopeptide (TPR) repeat protein